MTTQELEQVILEYIQEITNTEYVGKIDIKKLEPIGYCVKLGLSVPERPLTIYAELEDDEFLDFIKKDLQSRNFPARFYGQLNLVYPEECGERSTKCSCKD